MEEGSSGLGGGAGPEVETPQGLLHAAAVVDAGHHLLAQVAPLGVAHGRLFRPRLLGKILRAEVAAETRDARLGAQHLQGLEAGGDDAGNLQQPLREVGRDRGRNPQGVRRGAEPAGALERHLGAVDRGADVTPVSNRRQLRLQDLGGPGTEEGDGQHVLQGAHLHPVRQDVLAEVGGQGAFLSRRELEPEAVLVDEHHDVGEDPPLRVGEEAVGPLAGPEPLDLARHVGVEEAVAVRAQQLQAPGPGAVRQAASLAHRPDLPGHGTVAQGSGGAAVDGPEDGSQTLVELDEGQGLRRGGLRSGRHALSLQSLPWNRRTRRSPFAWRRRRPS